MFKSLLDQYPRRDSRKPKLFAKMAIEHFDNKVTGSLLCYWVLEEKLPLSKEETGKSHYVGKIHLQ